MVSYTITIVRSPRNSVIIKAPIVRLSSFKVSGPKRPCFRVGFKFRV